MTNEKLTLSNEERINKEIEDYAKELNLKTLFLLKTFLHETFQEIILML